MIPLIAALLLATGPAARLDGLVAEGRIGEAEEGYRAWVERDPGSVDALLGLCRILRWTGRPLESRALASRAVALAPGRTDTREELARTYVAEALPEEANESLAGAAPQDVRSDLSRLRRVSVVVSSAASDDTNGVGRVAPRIAVEVPLPSDVRLTVGAGMSALRSPDVVHQLVGASVQVPFEHVTWKAAYVLHEGAGTLAHEGEAAVQVRPIDALGATLSVRRRPLIETADSLATDESAFHGAGAGGALDPAAAQWIFVDEARLALQIAPLRFMYAYGEGRAMLIDDGNHSWSVASGVGLDLIALAGMRAPMQLYARWDAYFTGFASPRTAYFSPASLDGQSPGLDLRVRFADAISAGVEVGRTFSLSGATGGGWFGGGQLAVQASTVSLALHGQIRDDPWYGSRRLWLAVRTSF